MADEKPKKKASKKRAVAKKKKGKRAVVKKKSSSTKVEPPEVDAAKVAEAMVKSFDAQKALSDSIYKLFGGNREYAGFEGVSHITLMNFKGFSDPVKIPLSPITLLLGANSAGKSTILQSLHYVRELIENNNADPFISHINDVEMDLGGFRSLVHKHDLDREIRIRLQMDMPADGIADYVEKFSDLADELDWIDDHPHEYDGLNTYLGIFSEEDMLNIGLEVAAKWDRGSATAFFSEYSILANGILLMTITRTSPVVRPMLSYVNYMHPGFVTGLCPEVDDLGQFEIEDIQSRLEKCRKAVQNKSGDDLQIVREHIFDSPNIEFTTWSSPFPKSFYEENLVDPSGDTTTTPDITDRDNLPFRGLFLAILWGATDYFRKTISDQRYIGPIRSKPPREMMGDDLATRKSWANGLEAWRRLAESYGDTETSDLLDSLNSWIGSSEDDERLAMGYELRITINKLINKNSDLMRDLTHLEKGFELEPERFVERVKLRLSSLPNQTTIKLYDSHTGVEVNIQDVGTGVAQVIPVIVGALDKGGTLMMVEQPELHVHPDAQSRLADLFVAQSQKSRTFILETHSEHMLLRLRRRIREGKLKPNELGVLFVKRAEGEGSPLEISKLRVDEDGELIDPWPSGFFESGYDDLFAGQ